MENERSFYKKTCKILCGTEQGTGFLIDGYKVVTASHVLTQIISDPTVEIKAVFDGAEGGNKTEYIVTPLSKEWKKYPVAVLAAQEKIADITRTFGIQELSESDSVSVYGFLNDKSSALQFKFDVNRRIYYDDPEKEYSNVILSPDAAERTKNFQGLSGSPVVLNGFITGILLRQELENQEAIRLYAITGVQFRKYLSNQNVEVKVASLTEGEGKRRSNLQIGSIASTEIDNLLSKQFEPIRSERINGDFVGSWKQLQAFLAELPMSMCSHKQKAEFYYSGALWALSDGKQCEAEQYLRQAQIEDPEIDLSTYYAYEYIQSDNTEAARELLLPVGSAAELNLLLLCAIKEKRTIAYVQDEFYQCKIEADSETNRLMALIALNSNDYSTARKYVEQAFSQFRDAPGLLICDALISYWEAMNSVYPTCDRLGFICCEKRHFSPTTLQRENLEHAYLQLEKAYHQIAIPSQNQLSAQIVWGLAVVSTLLPGKDPIRWIEELMSNDDMVPSVILFMSDWGVKIAEDVQAEFLSRPIPNKDAGIHLLAVLQLYINGKRYSDAIQLFDEYGDLIAKTQNMDRDMFKLQLLLDCNLLDEAQEQLTAMKLPDTLKERYELGIAFKSGKRYGKALAVKAVALANKTNTALDYENANLICHKTKTWKQAEKNAKAWFQVTGELYALECVAAALEEQQRYPKALRVICRAESLGDVSEYIRQIKLNCYVGLSKFEEAIELSQTFDNCRSNAKLVMFQANSYLASGQKDQAVNVLQSYIDEGQFDFEVYKMFVALIQPDEPDSAFRYAYHLYLHDPENEDYLRFAGLIGIMTGHKELSEQFAPLFQADAKKGDYVRVATTSEVKEILKKERENNRYVAEQYQKAMIPLHFAEDSFAHGNLGFTYFEILRNNRTWLSRYGGREDYKEEANCSGVILDYTACLTLMVLELFPDVLTLYSDVWIPSKLLGIWLADINDLKKIQPHIEVKNSALYKALGEISYICEPIGLPEEKVATLSYNTVDVITSNCARKYSAYIIDDTPNGIIMEESVPEEWYDWQIKPEELYAALDELGMPYPPYNKEKTNPQNVQKLKEPCNIILNVHVLESLLDANALRQVSEFYSIILPENEIRKISNIFEDNLLRREAAEWLEKGYQTVSDLYIQGQVKICPIFQKSLPEQNRYAGLLEEEIHCAESWGCTVVCDDRFITSFTQISGKRGRHGDILSTADLLLLLNKHGIINRNVFYEKIDKLLQQNYSYFIPPADYVFNRLSLCSVNENGDLLEITSLGSLRRCLAIAFNVQQGLQSQPLRHGHRTELAGYVLILSHAFSENLNMVWTAEKNEKWKCAASNWLLMTMGDTLCDIAKADLHLQDWQPTKQAILIMEGIRFVDKKDILKPYFEWAFSYMRASWINDYTLKLKTVDSMCNIIKALDEEEMPEKLDVSSWNAIKLSFFVEFLTSLPVDFMKLVLENPKMQKYSRVITVHKTVHFHKASGFGPTFIPDEKILSGDEDCMEEAIIAVVKRPSENGSKILDLFSDERMGNVDKLLRYRLARFLFELSWYLPVETMYVAQEKKRYLALLRD